MSPLSSVSARPVLPAAPPLRIGVKEFQFSDGYTVKFRHWQPPVARPRGFIVAVHGIQSHSGWYEQSSRRLCEAGYEIAFLDRRGSGLNDVRRGHAPHEDRLINDVVQFLTYVRRHRDQHAPESPVILKSVSWGGKLALATYARRPDLVDALALLYPGLIAKIRPSWFQVVLLHLVEWKGWGGHCVRIPLIDPTLFTDEPEWQRFIENDPMTLRLVSCQFLLASMRMTRQAEASAERIRCPVLMMLAGRDRIIDNEEMHRFYERIASRDKRLIEYPDACHTLEFERNPEPFITSLIEWLDQLPRREPPNVASSSNGDLQPHFTRPRQPR